MIFILGEEIGDLDGLMTEFSRLKIAEAEFEGECPGWGDGWWSGEGFVAYGDKVAVIYSGNS